MLARVIFDNGYKLELIRPCSEFPLRIGAQVDVTVREETGDLVKIFDTMLDEDVQARIMAQIQKEMTPKQKVSTK